MESKRYWTSLEALNNEAPVEAKDEFAEELPVADMFDGEKGLSSGRRDFLKMLGFSVSAATLAASCEVPVRKAIPYVIKPEDITPGIATWYASSFLNGSDWCPIMVKTREGRPIKIEGNRWSKVSQGGIDTKALASVLSLYSTHRLKGPLAKTGDELSATSWDAADKAISGKLEANPDARIAILSHSVISPSTQKAIGEFRKAYANAYHISYDPVSDSGLLDANARMFGKRAFPDYRFNKADLVVSFGADYLGSWGSAIENQKGWAANRKLDRARPSMSRTYQFESYMSRTGSNADYRVPLATSKLGIAMLHLHDALAAKAGRARLSNVPGLENEKAEARVRKAADDLWSSRGKSLVLCGINDVHAQTVANSINTMLGNYGKTISWDHPVKLKQGNDNDLTRLAENMGRKQVDVLIVYNCNPAYDVSGFADLLASVETKICTNGHLNETAELCDFVLPDHHYLESWNDAEPKKGFFSLCQPTIRPLFDTRQAQESFMKWAGVEGSWYDYLSANWRENLLTGESNARQAWQKALQYGIYEPNGHETGHLLPEGNLAGDDEIPTGSSVPISQTAGAIRKAYLNADGAAEVTMFENPVIGNGSFTDNPWLQETPDPITKVTWDNVAMVNPGWARENGLKDGEHINVKTAQGDITAPVVLQPGQVAGSIAVALGYGRSATGHEATNCGANAYQLVGTDRLGYAAAEWTRVTGSTTLARTQTYDSLFDDSDKKRPHVKETTLAAYRDDRMAGNHDREHVLTHLKSFYPDRFENKNGFHWGMAVDLGSCIGCSACHVACQSENNIPVVGKVEVDRKHDMHWMRIDRYYAGSEDDPEVVFQPMMCQHCDQAPCENVCPVAATNHSSEGLNQMAYNRCIGTRYCANNCPYKVRRFNWFDYMGADSFGSFNDRDVLASGGETNNGLLSDLTRMVLNPDVTVRSRGVMEKCSFCVQRIQESKLAAKLEGRQMVDGDVVTACQAACTTGAISFGNTWDKDSEVYKLSEENERAFRVIEEFHTLPSVTYLTKVRNKQSEDHIHDVPFEGTLNAKQKT